MPMIKHCPRCRWRNLSLPNPTEQSTKLQNRFCITEFGMDSNGMSMTVRFGMDSKRMLELWAQIQMWRMIRLRNWRFGGIFLKKNLNQRTIMTAKWHKMLVALDFKLGTDLLRWNFLKKNLNQRKIMTANKMA